MPHPGHAPIVTLTLNPAIDLTTSVKGMAPQRKLRCEPPLREPGGGGLNVSRVIRELGGRSAAVYTCGGVTGQLLVRLVDASKIDHHPVEIAGETRENISVTDESTGALYRFVMPGPTLRADELARVGAKVRDSFGGVATGGFLVVSGSLPEGVPEDVFERIAHAARDTGLRVVADVSGVWLRRVAEAGATVIKPSQGELEEFVGGTLETDAELSRAAEQLRALGDSEAVLVSLGPGGVLCVTRERSFRVLAPSVRVVSTVGAGDSMVAGVVLELARGRDLEAAVRFGVAAGTASCLSPGTSLCRRQDVERLAALIG